MSTRAARTKFGRRACDAMRRRSETERYWAGGGGCSYGPGVVLCHDPEYGYGMTVFADLHERDQQHAYDEGELGHRAASFLGVAHDAGLAMYHAIKRCGECGHEPVARGSDTLATLYECPARDEVIKHRSRRH